MVCPVCCRCHWAHAVLSLCTAGSSMLLGLLWSFASTESALIAARHPPVAPLERQQLPASGFHPEQQEEPGARKQSFAPFCERWSVVFRHGVLSTRSLDTSTAGNCGCGSRVCPPIACCSSQEVWQQKVEHSVQLSILTCCGYDRGVGVGGEEGRRGTADCPAKLRKQASAVMCC
jgi:hypothetical protein